MCDQTSKIDGFAFTPGCHCACNDDLRSPSTTSLDDLTVGEDCSVAPPPSPTITCTTNQMSENSRHTCSRHQDIARHLPVELEADPFFNMQLTELIKSRHEKNQGMNLIGRSVKEILHDFNLNEPNYVPKGQCRLEKYAPEITHLPVLAKQMCTEEREDSDVRPLGTPRHDCGIFPKNSLINSFPLRKAPITRKNTIKSNFKKPSFSEFKLRLPDRCSELSTPRLSVEKLRPQKRYTKSYSSFKTTGGDAGHYTSSFDDIRLKTRDKIVRSIHNTPRCADSTNSSSSAAVCKEAKNNADLNSCKEMIINADSKSCHTTYLPPITRDKDSDMSSVLANMCPGCGASKCSDKDHKVMMNKISRLALKKRMRMFEKNRCSRKGVQPRNYSNYTPTLKYTCYNGETFI